VNKNLKNTLTVLAFLSPWIIGLCVFTLWPIASSFYYSLTDYNIIQEPTFVGWDNYTSLLFTDTQFWNALGNTLYMVVFGIAFITVVTLSISILMDDKRIRGLDGFRVVFFIPTLVPLVVLSILWIWILHPTSGIVNGFLGTFGVHGPGWFSDPTWSKPSFVLMYLWCSGNTIIIYLAGLKDIPVPLFEAADLDGASFLQKTWRITLPMLRPVILFNVVTGIISILQAFAEPYIITQGGPNATTEFYSLYLYRNAFSYFKMGYASAMAWILLILAVAIVLLLFRWDKKIRNES